MEEKKIILTPKILTREIDSPTAEELREYKGSILDVEGISDIELDDYLWASTMLFNDGVSNALVLIGGMNGVSNLVDDPYTGEPVEQGYLGAVIKWSIETIIMDIATKAVNFYEDYSQFSTLDQDGQNDSTSKTIQGKVWASVKEQFLPTLKSRINSSGLYNFVFKKTLPLSQTIDFLQLKDLIAENVKVSGLEDLGIFNEQQAWDKIKIIIQEQTFGNGDTLNEMKKPFNTAADVPFVPVTKSKGRRAIIALDVQEAIEQLDNKDASQDVFISKLISGKADKITSAGNKILEVEDGISMQASSGKGINFVDKDGVDAIQIFSSGLLVIKKGLNVNNGVINNVGNGIESQHGVNKGQLDQKVDKISNVVSGEMSIIKAQTTSSGYVEIAANSNGTLYIRQDGNSIIAIGKESIRFDKPADLDNHKILKLADGTEDKDGVNKSQLDTKANEIYVGEELKKKVNGIDGVINFDNDTIFALDGVLKAKQASGETATFSTGEILNETPIDDFGNLEKSLITGQVIKNELDNKVDKNTSEVAIGIAAGDSNQGIRAVAIGVSAGYERQGESSVAIGTGASEYSQGDYAVAIGQDAGNDTQGTKAVAIGQGAGNDGQGESSVAIGSMAGNAYQPAKSIHINSSGIPQALPLENEMRVDAGTTIFEVKASGLYINGVKVSNADQLKIDYNKIFNTLTPIGTIQLGLTKPTFGIWSDLGALTDGQSIVGGASTNGSNQKHTHTIKTMNSYFKMKDGKNEGVHSDHTATTSSNGKDDKNRAWGKGLGSNMHVWKRTG